MKNQFYTKSMNARKHTNHDTAGITRKEIISPEDMDESTEALEELIDEYDEVLEESEAEIARRKYPPRPHRPLFRDFSIGNFLLQIVVVLLVVGVIAGVVYYVPKILSPEAGSLTESVTPTESEEESGAQTPTGAATSTPQEPSAPIVPETRLRIMQTETGWLNVRASPNLNGTQITRVLPGEEYEYTAQEEGWYQIKIDSETTGWVFGEYVELLTQ